MLISCEFLPLFNVVIMLTRGRGRVYALAMFRTGFEADTMSKEAGKRFRDMVLRVGGSQPEMKTLTDYLGCEPSIEPYFEWLGVI